MNNHESLHRHSILIVDDEAGIRHGLKNWFKRNFNVYESATYENAISLAKQYSIDIAVLDIRLKKPKDGIALFRELKKNYPEMVVILITGFGDVEDAVLSMKEGATDYFLKPVDNHKLSTSINNALKIQQLKQENEALKRELSQQNPVNHFIAKNVQMQSIRDKVDLIKNDPVTILITGESGTGKEVLAHYIHHTSNRKKRNYVTLNCAAISETLLLSELFGHEKGAFTGANARKIGKFELADRGSFFMDEIGDMSLANQAALLRVLETQRFERVGGNQTLHVDVKLITATNQDLSEMVEKKTFRQDLYYRLHVIHFKLPALRERPEDIPLLVEHFRKTFNQKYHKHVQQFHNDTLAMFLEYNWPGNIRELSNVVNQVVLLCRKDTIAPEDVDYPPLSKKPSPPTSSFSFSNVRSLHQAREQIADDYEKQLILHFLTEHCNNQTQTAKALQITRKTLARKILKYGIDLKK